MKRESVTTSVDPRDYRDVIGRFVTGVAVVTTATEGGPVGMTVNSLTSVSLEPTLVLVCLKQDSRTSAAIHEANRFVINILDYRQRSISNAFARPGDDHFAGIEYTSTDGLPILTGALGHLRCRVWDTYDGGDHRIVVGEVIACDRAAGDPLVFYAGSYARQISDDDYPEPNWWG